MKFACHRDLTRRTFTFTFTVSWLGPTPTKILCLGNSWLYCYCRWANVIGSSCLRCHSSFSVFIALPCAPTADVPTAAAKAKIAAACGCGEYYVSLFTWPRIRCILVYTADTLAKSHRTPQGSTFHGWPGRKGS